MTIKIKIDKTDLEVEAGSTIIEAADKIGVHIPRFCYHKKLSVAANCRMCLVEVENCPKALPACATPVTDGMVVKTKSVKAIDAQKAVMEFLLINHPLDCPICDQGGECELQDVAMGYGSDSSLFSEVKRVVEDKDIGPLISTEMTRCIHCTRCVRFGTEIAGLREFGATGRGEDMQIGTFLEKSIDSELSGNVIDLCPVGALTSKPFRFKARNWELKQHRSVSPHDCFGTNIYLHTLHNEVKRVVPANNETINEVWISDRDRFSYTAIHSEDRLMKPLLKKKDKMLEVDWKEALEFSAHAVKSAVKKFGPEKLSTLVSANSTTEELYLLQKLSRDLGSNNIDYRINKMDSRDDLCQVLPPNLGVSIEDIEEQELIVLVGLNVHKEIPLLGVRIRKAIKNGAKVIAINPVDYEYNFPLEKICLVEHGDISNSLAKIVKALAVKNNTKLLSTFESLISEVDYSKEDEEIANLIASANKSCLFMGHDVFANPISSTIRYFTKILHSFHGVSIGNILPYANAYGAHLSGCLPHLGPGISKLAGEPGISYARTCEAGQKIFFIYNFEPDKDVILPHDTMKVLEHADLVIAFSPYKSESLCKVADVILPIGTFAETSGTFVNTEGKWQSFNAAITAAGESRPGWKVLRVLGNFLGLDGYDYESSADVLFELQKQIGKLENKTAEEFVPNTYSLPKHGIINLPMYSLYGFDQLSRRSLALQKTVDAIKFEEAVYMSLTTLNKLKLNSELQTYVMQSAVEIKLPIKIDNKLLDDTVYIPKGLLPHQYATVEFRQE